MAAAELKLQVGLDLAFFRQQLAQLGNVAIGYHMPINIKFSPIVIQQELSRLKKNIGKTQYTININTNLEAEIRNADRLVKALQRVQRESASGRSGLPVDIRQLRKTKSQGGFSAADIKTLFNAAIEGGLLDEKTLGKTREQMVTAFAGIGKDSIEGLLNGLSSADASIRAAAESIGATLITTTKASLGMRSPSKRFEEIGKNVGKGFENGVLSSMDAAFNALEQKMQQRMKALDTIARGIFHMLGMDPAAMMAAQRQKLLPPSISWPASAATSPSYQGKPGTMLPGAPAPTLISGAAGPFGLLPRTTRAGAMGDMMRMLSQGADEESPGVLAKTTKARIDEIINKYLRVVEVQVKQIFNAPFELKKQLNTFSYLVQALRDAETRTAQMQMPTTKAIRGTAFGSQKYLPTALGDETKKVLRDAAHAFLNVMREEMRKVVYQVNVQDLGQAINRQSMLPGGRTAGYLPPVARFGVGRDPNPYSTGRLGREGETQAELFARREREARIKSAFREMDVMGGGAGRTAASYNYAYRAARPTSAMVPYAAGGALVTGGGAPPAPPIPPGGGRGGFGSFGGFGGAMPNVALPGAGLVRELGDQFGYATQQVLLFGAAYKALAFLTDFPSRVGEAVAQLQTFRNALTAVTGGGQEFGKSNKFILDLVERYNIPLQSARDGFTKLYASMAPAGFKGDEIRNIFTGISQGAATFGMSADKVDRVNYAFAQMASKGQVMSEELKGQLGDVLPGAVAIFAEAAGFTGPEALVKFTKAMEDGRYKGAAMKQLLINVGTVMNKEFGPGAEGAARTFQGLMNRMQNATLKLYEAFEPMAIGFANKVVLPMTDGLKVAADGFNAFFTGQQAVTKGGAELAAKLQDLRPTFEGLAANAKAVASRVIDLSKAFLPLLELGARLLSSPLIGVLAQIYVSVLLVNGAFSMLAATGIARATAALITGLIPATQQSTFLMYQLTLVSRGMWLAITGPAGLAVLAIAAATAALYAMHKPSRDYLDTVPDRFANFWRDLQSQATASISKVNAMWQGLATVTSETFRSMTSGASTLYTGLVTALTPIAPWFGDMMQWLKNAWMETIAFMVNQSNPILGIAKMLGVDVGKTLVVNFTKDRNLPAPGQFTPAGGVSFDAQGNPIGAPLSPFIPGGGALSPIPGATGDGGSGSKAADKAAKAEQQAQEKLRSLNREIELSTQLITLKELQFEAEMSGDRELLIRLQGEERSLGILHATASALDGITDSRIRQKELAKAESQIFAERQNVAFNLARFEDERTKSFEDTIADLNLELDLKKATTEQAREQLRLDAERRKLINQKLFTPEQIDAIMQRKGELARPQTDAEKVQSRIDELRRGLDELTNPANTLIGIAGSIGDSFGASFKGIIDGSMTAQQALAGFFQNLSNYFADAVSKMIAEWLKVEAIKGLKSLLPNLFGGGAGFAFTGDSGFGATAFGSGFQVPGFAFANGGIAPKGFQAFATGGIVTGPTLGLVGEGRYNEAVIPLPDGKSVPVDLGGMSGGMSSSPIMVNVSVDAKGSTVEGDENRANDLGRAISVAVQSELVKQQRPGGLLASTRR